MIYHTSPNGNLKACKFTPWEGVFGEFIFFSDKEYVMTAGDYHTYTLNEEELNIVAASDLEDLFNSENEDHAEILNDCAKLFNTTQKVALLILTENLNEWQRFPEICDAEKSFEVQRLTAAFAKACGYDGVEVQDEQGTAYMIDMSKHKNLLNKT